MLKQLSPGASWVGAGRGVQYEYRSNETLEDVRIWTIGSATTAVPTTSAAYAANELMVTVTTDEDGKKQYEYKDKLGRLIMTKRFYEDLHSIAHPGYACTYYVYDDLNRLRYVIPPLAMVTSWDIATVPELCYRYVYDTRGRLIEKKIPGKGIESYVYDKRDRQVLYQDAKMKAAGKWLFTLYDALNRPTITGLYTSSSTQASLTTSLTNTTTFASPHLFYFLKNYNLYNSYPATITSCEILSYTYYDNYASLPATGYGYDGSQFPTFSLPYTVVPEKSDNTRGLVTGSKVKVLGSSPLQWLTSVNYYDEKARLIQTIADNHKGGKDIGSNVYYFQGMVWKNILRHQNPTVVSPSGSDFSITKIENTYARNLGYSGGNDQVWKVTQTINDGTPYEFAYYDYDHLGKVTTKMFPAGNVLQEYNIRGWLNRIRAYNANGPLINQKVFFEENLYYDKGFGSKLYNGNIAGITWSGYRSAAAAVYTQKSYGYSYDKLDRLTHAEYRQKSSTGSTWSKTSADYTTSGIEYDYNGNIEKMKHRGVLPGGTVADIDILDYDYAPNSNQLIKVEDAISGTTTGTLPDFKNGSVTAIEYTYDLNGNMEKDNNKAISQITYNYLNKPEQIVVTGKGTISYVYDAAGNRLKKTITPTSGSPTVYDYIGNFVYKNNQLEYILNEEGRTRPLLGDPAAGLTFTYDYFVKDHLGNVRSTVNAQAITTDYLAAHEISTYGAEHLVFDNIANVWDGNPQSSPGNERAAHLVASDPEKRIGTAIMLRTMPGDEFRISVDAYHQGKYKPEGTVNASDMVSSLTSALMGGETYTGVPVSEMPRNAAIISQMMQNPSLPATFGEMLSAETDPAKPQAYLSYLVFDRNMNMIPDKSGTVQVPLGDGNGLPWTEISPATLDGDLLATTDPGYIVIFIHNNSIGKDVWFDNLKIEHYNGTVLDDNHYYPFGLTLTSTAAGAAPNPYKYNGKELTNDFGLEWYSYGAREYDPQIGRFPSIDRFAEKYHSFSTYQYAANNPAYYIDVNGDSLWVTHRTGFLGLGKKETLLYDNGNLFNKDGSAYEGKVTGFLSKTVNALTTLNGTKEGASIIGELQSSTNNFTIVSAAKSEFENDNVDKAYANQTKNDPVRGPFFEKMGKDLSGGAGGTIFWNASGVSIPTLDGFAVNATVDLGHEMGHALDANRGLLNDTKIDGVKTSEFQAVYRENLIRSELQLPLRTHYLRGPDKDGIMRGMGPRMLTPSNELSPPQNYKR